MYICIYIYTSKTPSADVSSSWRERRPKIAGSKERGQSSTTGSAILPFQCRRLEWFWRSIFAVVLAVSTLFWSGFLCWFISFSTMFLYLTFFVGELNFAGEHVVGSSNPWSCFVFFLGDIPQRLDFFSRLCRHLDVPLHARVKKHVFFVEEEGWRPYTSHKVPSTGFTDLRDDEHVQKYLL